VAQNAFQLFCLQLPVRQIRSQHFTTLRLLHRACIPLCCIASHLFRKVFNFVRREQHHMLECCLYNRFWRAYTNALCEEEGTGPAYNLYGASA
jgi:hypothetical protein